MPSSLGAFLAELVQRNLDGVLAAVANEPASLSEPKKLVANEPESAKKQMGEEAQALVVSCMESVRKLAWKYADGSYDRFEELVNSGMLGLCEGAAVMPAGCTNPVGYLYKAAQHDMINELQRLHECSTDSLDAPLSDTGDFCLADRLSDRSASAVVPSPTSRKRLRALQKALLRLPARQRAAVRRRAGLPGYGAHSVEEVGRALRTCSTNAAECLGYRGRHNLARDAWLCEVMGVEVER